ncbi:MAG: P-loop NTPase fold protein [Cellvibrionaceae bacterium]
MKQDKAITSPFERFALQDDLPSSFVDDAREYYWHLSRSLADKIKAKEIAVIGISGSQGSGKSTLAKLLRQIFEEVDGLRAIDLSIDDFYLTRQEREHLASSVHPLLLSRGVPGTHDVSLAIKTIENVLSPNTHKVLIPRFDKSTDDRKPKSEWEEIIAPVNVVILEGWFVSIPPQKSEALHSPINDLEKQEDPDQSWRSFVNNSLQNEYSKLFNLIDYSIFLESPNFKTVYEWRTLQEDKLKHSLSAADIKDKKNKTMNANELKRFIQHFERLTNHGYKTLPDIVDVIFTLNNEHRITQRIDKNHDGKF